jgi:hypothetical protein
LPAVTGEGRLVRGLIGDGGLTVAAGGTAKAKVQAQQTEPGSGERD